jgi:hypothetical protein
MGSQNLIGCNYHHKDSIYYDEMVIRIKSLVTLITKRVKLGDEVILINSKIINQSKVGTLKGRLNKLY